MVIKANVFGNAFRCYNYPPGISPIVSPNTIDCSGTSTITVYGTNGIPGPSTTIVVLVSVDGIVFNVSSHSLVVPASSDFEFTFQNACPFVKIQLQTNAASAGSLTATVCAV